MPTGVQQTGAAVKFGVSQTFTGFIVSSANRSKNPRISQEIVNEQGLTVAVIHAGFDEEVTLSLMVLAGTDEPSVGEVLTDGAPADWLINSVSIREENEQAVVYDLTVKKYEGLDLTP